MWRANGESPAAGGVAPPEARDSFLVVHWEERGLRERAVTSARDAEVLLRWRQTVRPPDAPPGVGLDAMSEAKLERLHAGLVRLASLDDTILAALLEQVLADDELASSS
jgi:hypothetical protein